MIEEVKMKICPRCNLTKLLTSEFFYRCKGKKSGFHDACKKCLEEEKKEYRSKKAQKADRKCATCRKVKPAIPEFFSLSRRKNGPLGHICHECSNNPELKEKTLLFFQGLRKCTDCCEVRSIENYYTSGNAIYTKCKACEAKRNKVRLKTIIITPPKVGDTKECLQCTTMYPNTDEFYYKSRAIKSGLSATCQKCINRAAAIKQREIKKQVFLHYGGGELKCICNCGCSESNFWLLTLDHVDGLSEEEREVGRRKGSGFYTYLKVRHYPEKYKLRLLCFNCNCGRSLTPTKECPRIYDEYKV